MKIRKVLDKKVGNTEYQKYLITLPKNIVEGSNLLGKDLKIKIDKDSRGRLYGECDSLYKSLKEERHKWNLCIFVFDDSDMDLQKKE